MTENKRFTLIMDYDDEIGVKENRTGDVLVLKHRDLNSEQFVAQLVVFLNEQNDAIEKLIKDEKYWEKKAIERINELEKENQVLQQFKDNVEKVFKIVYETDLTDRTKAVIDKLVELIRIDLK